MSLGFGKHILKFLSTLHVQSAKLTIIGSFLLSLTCQKLGLKLLKLTKFSKSIFKFPKFILDSKLSQQGPYIYRRFLKVGSMFKILWIGLELGKLTPNYSMTEIWFHLAPATDFHIPTIGFRIIQYEFKLRQIDL